MVCIVVHETPDNYIIMFFLLMDTIQVLHLVNISNNLCFLVFFYAFTLYMNIVISAGTALTLHTVMTEPTATR